MFSHKFDLQSSESRTMRPGGFQILGRHPTSSAAPASGLVANGHLSRASSWRSASPRLQQKPRRLPIRPSLNGRSKSLVPYDRGGHRSLTARTGRDNSKAVGRRGLRGFEAAKFVFMVKAKLRLLGSARSGVCVPKMKKWSCICVLATLNKKNTYTHKRTKNMFRFNDRRLFTPHAISKKATSLMGSILGSADRGSWKLGLWLLVFLEQAKAEHCCRRCTVSRVP